MEGWNLFFGILFSYAVGLIVGFWARGNK
jgi:hypothetical protein